MWGLWGRAIVVGKACAGAARGQEAWWSLVQGSAVVVGPGWYCGSCLKATCLAAACDVLSPLPVLGLFSRDVLAALGLFPSPWCVH